MLVRIDDFPTGVKRRETDDINTFRVVLDEFEQRKVSYTLGVVPYLCSPSDLGFITGLKYCTVALHGFSHNYGKWAGTNFPEFSGINYAEPIKNILWKGISHLNEWGIDKPDVYIPPFNQLTQATVEALNDLGFKAITSGIDGYPNLKFPDHIRVLTPKREFYGRSYEMIEHIEKFNPATDHLCLHLTWEADCLRSENWLLPELLDSLTTACAQTK